jgi:hypothetical protein
MKFYTFWFAHFVESERKRDSWELKFLNISNRGWFNRIFRCCRSQFGRNSEITPAFDHCYAHTFFSSPPPCPVVCGWTRAQQRCFSPPPLRFYLAKRSSVHLFNPALQVCCLAGWGHEFPLLMVERNVWRAVGGMQRRKPASATHAVFLIPYFYLKNHFFWTLESFLGNDALLRTKSYQPFYSFVIINLFFCSLTIFFVSAQSYHHCTVFGI